MAILEPKTARAAASGRRPRALLGVPRRMGVAVLVSIGALGCDDGGAGADPPGADATATLDGSGREDQRVEVGPREDATVRDGQGGAGGQFDEGAGDLGAEDLGDTDRGIVDLGAEDRGGADLAVDAGPALVLRINEVNCDGGDWVELVGPADAVVAGYVLGDDDPSHRYALPAGARLDAAGYLQVVRGGADGGGFDFGLSCNETVSVYAPDGTALDAVTLPGEGPPTGLPATASFGRLPDRTGDFAPNRPTPGAPNAAWVEAELPLFVPGVPTQVDLQLGAQARDALNRDPRRTVPATLTLTLDSGVVLGPHTVGVRLKGRAGSFRDLNGKPAFKVDVNFADSALRLLGQKSITLNNAVQDPSYLHEHTAYTLLRAAGLPAPRTGHAWVTLDGEPQGVYVVVETWDDVALARHFDGTSLLVEGAYGQDLFPEMVFDLDVDEGQAARLADLVDLGAVLVNPPPEGAYAALLDRVHWDRVLGVMAGELLVGHWDGYAWTRNNWFMHLDAQGRLDLLPWGVDQTFNDFLPLYEGQGLLLNACLADAACVARYDAALVGVLAAWDGLDQAGDGARIAAALRPWIERENRREFGLDAVFGWQEWLPEYLRQRRAQVAEVLDCRLGDNPDPDGDGWLCAEDCAPEDPAVYPGAEDLCGDGIDQDCSGFADDDLRCDDCVEVRAAGDAILVCPTPRSYVEAEALCAERGRPLIRLVSAAQAALVHARAVDARFQPWWIGLDDRAEEGRFRWSDGTYLADDPAEQVAWADGEPNNAGEEDCAHFWPEAPVWNDIPCDARLGTLCGPAE